MAVAFTGDIDALKINFGGTVVLPGDVPYDESRSVWNGQIDRRPAVIARCSSAEDVSSAVKFARANGLEICVRGGGHNYSGNAVKDGAMMIHLGDMNTVTCDADKMRCTCGGGATWGDVDAVTQEHGLAVPGGFISHTGVAGLTLGGGVGWLTKLGGLSCDNLVGAEVVTADGSIVYASASENPDLFWALRGGGGNFGVVTRFEFNAHKVGPMVNVGVFFWGLDKGNDALKLMRDTVPNLPDDATGFIGAGLSSPPAPFVPEHYHHTPGYALIIVGFGSPERHGEITGPVRDQLPALWEFVTPIPFTALQQMFNDSATWGLFGYEKALYLNELSDDAIAMITQHAPKKTSPISFVPMFAMTGAYSTVDENETAFGGSRSAAYIMNVAGHVADAPGYEAERAWVREFWSAMQPFGTGSGGYINFQVEDDPDRVRDTYGAAKYDRLARIKAEYDPQNAFHFNANIKPAS